MRSWPARCSWLIGALAVSVPASAGQLVEGDRMRVHYDDAGVWNDREAGAGLQVLHGDAWVEYSYPGTPFAAWRVAWEDGGSAPEQYFASSSVPETNADVLEVADLSTDTMRVSRYAYQVGAVQFRKTEAWDADGSTMLVHFYVDNTDNRTISALQVMAAVDPDQDWPGTTNTLNSVADIDDDGALDVAISAGPETGHALVFGACQRGAELGHYAGWQGRHDISVGLNDAGGAVQDLAMGIRMTADADVAPGDSAQLSFLVSVGDTVEQALEAYAADRDLCGDCDADADGWLNPGCGGSDCDDSNPAANPGMQEVWYDGVDGDCDGSSDYDADRDGHDSDQHGGDDCDDADPAVNPDAVDEPYDGVDTDCDGASDLDADGDGYDSGGHGGDDCNDADPDVHPGAPDTEGDGVDSDCDGTDAEYIDPELVKGCGCAAGPEGALWWLLLPAVALLRRRRR